MDLETELNDIRDRAANAPNVLAMVTQFTDDYNSLLKIEKEVKALITSVEQSDLGKSLKLGRKARGPNKNKRDKTPATEQPVYAAAE